MKWKERKAGMLLAGDRQTGTHVFGNNNNNNNIMKSSDREIGDVINAEESLFRMVLGVSRSRAAGMAGKSNDAQPSGACNDNKAQEGCNNDYQA